MKHVWGGWLTLAILTAGPAWAIQPADREKVEHGETVTHEIHRDGMSGTETLFWVKAPVNACYAVLSDTAHLQEYMPACNQSIILSQHPGYTEVKLTSNMGEIIERRHLEPPFGVTWVLVRGTALKDMKGEWAIEPDQGGCILRYAVLVRPAIPLPGSLVNFFENKNLPDMVRNVRARIESGGRWAKPGSRRG